MAANRKTGRGNASIVGELERRRVSWAVELEVLRGRVQSHIDQVKALGMASSKDAAAVPDLSTEAERMVASAKHEHSKLIKVVETAEADKESYRLEHMLSRNPQRPLVFLEALKIGCAWVIETVANAGFFAQANMVASAGAALTVSGLISATNIALSCVGGFFIERYTHYGQHAANPDAPEFKNVRTRAKVQRIGFIAVMVGFTLTTGLVRSQERLEYVQHGLAAYQNLFTHPEAVFLMLTSACISVFTYFKAKRAFADEYPGYTKRQVAVDDANEAIEDCREEWKENTEAIFDEQIAAIEAQQKAHDKARAHRDKAFDQCVSAYRTLQEKTAIAQQELRAECAQLISEFKSRGGKLEATFDLNAHCSFGSLLEGLGFPKAVSDHPAESILQDIKLNKAIALERLSQTFTQ